MLVKVFRYLKEKKSIYTTYYYVDIEGRGYPIQFIFNQNKAIENLKYNTNAYDYNDLLDNNILHFKKIDSLTPITYIEMKNKYGVK